MKLKHIKLVALSAFAGLAFAAENSLRESFTATTSNKEVVELVVKSLSTSPSNEVIKEAIIGTNADAGLVNAIVSAAKVAQPEQSDLITLTAFTYAPDAFSKFGGSSKDSVAGDTKIVYNVYGVPIGRAVKTSEKEFAVYSPEGEKIGKLIKEGTNNSATLKNTNAKQQGIVYTLYLEGGVTVEIVFGNSPVRRGGRGGKGIQMCESVDGNVVVLRPKSFTVNTTDEAGVTVTKSRSLGGVLVSSDSEDATPVLDFFDPTPKEDNDPSTDDPIITPESFEEFLDDNDIDYTSTLN